MANLPFGVTDDQLREVFQDVGPVKSIRCVSYTCATCRQKHQYKFPCQKLPQNMCSSIILWKYSTVTRFNCLGQCVNLLYRIVTDRDTGKQKGFAFLEYFDTQTAESAIRNMNEFDLNGRKLKVHFAANDMDSKLRTGQGKGVSRKCSHSKSACAA